MSQNHWIRKSMQRKLHLSIDNKAMECWSKDKDFGEFIASLTKEEVKYLMSFKMKDFAGDPDEPSFGFEMYCD